MLCIMFVFHSFGVLLVFTQSAVISESLHAPSLIIHPAGISHVDLLKESPIFEDCLEKKFAAECRVQRTIYFLIESASLSSAMTIYRLPLHVKPLSYRLKMVPNLRDEFGFYGEVTINVSVLENSNIILLHSYQLGISDLDIYHRNDHKIESSFEIDPVNQLLRIQTNEFLQKDEIYEIIVKFNGILKDELVGFYRSWYSIENETKWIATTQFETTHARQAFPCFDEPHFRATFDITIAREPSQVALSNMPLRSTSDPDPLIGNRVWSTFDRTPPMPTYLVAFVVGELDHLSDTSGKFKTWMPKNVINDARYVQSKVPEIVKCLEEFTGIEYSLPKLDLVGMPDFFRGAMENWGLIIFKQNLILNDDERDNVEEQRQSSLRIAVHELAHQWFGNYVTIQWWDCMWLKEGFAVLLEYIIGAVIEPNWRMDELFVHETFSKALEVDGIRLHESMTNPVNTPAEINAHLNEITYDKGASILRMLSNIVSPNTFRMALNIFLCSGYESGGVVIPDDLWAAFEKQLALENRTLGNGFTLNEIMRTWTDQPGYPVVTVSRYSRGNRVDIGLKQEVFKSFFEKVNTTAEKWIIPLTCTKQSHSDFSLTEPTVWLVNERELILENEVGNDEWYMCNVQATGYYRVNYDGNGWLQIIDLLYSTSERIHQLNRYQIIDDVFYLAKAEIISYGIAFRVSRYLDKEKDSMPWIVALKHMHELILFHEGTKAFQKLKEFLNDRLETIYQKIGFYEQPNDDLVTKKFRSQLLSVICEFGNTDCLSKADSEFKKHTSVDSIPPYLLKVVLCATFKVNSSLATWNKLWDFYEKTSSSESRNTVIQAFGCASDEFILKRNLFGISEGMFRKGIRSALVDSLLRYYRGVLAALNFIREILPNISNYVNGERIVNHVLWKIPEYIRSSEQINLIKEMLNEIAVLNAQPYLNITKQLKEIKNVAEQNLKIYEQKSSKILEALSSTFVLKRSSDISLMQPQKSAAKDSSRQLINCLILVYILIHIWTE